MKIAQIASIGVSAKNKTYGKLASGAVVFGNKDLKLEAGMWIIYNESLQTQDAEGKELETPIPVNVVASVWKTKMEAIEAKNESALIDLEEVAFLESRKKAIVKEFTLENVAETA